MLFFHLLGTGLIAIGVAGEFGVHIKAGKIETDLRNDTLTLVGLLNKEAAGLLAQIQPRDLSPSQQSEIRKAVEPFSGKTVYVRSYPNDPEAARLIVEIKAALEPPIHVEDRTGELLDTWNTSSLVFGIRVEPGKRDRAFAEALVNSFRANGKLLVGPSPLNSEQSTTVILVGIKPVTVVKQDGTVRSRKNAKTSRHLNPEQIARIAARLRPFPKQVFALVWNKVDTETDELAHDFLEACCVEGAAEWQAAVGLLNDTKNGPIGVKIYLQAETDEVTRAAAKALRSALANELPDVDPQVEGADLGRVLSPYCCRFGSSIPSSSLVVVFGKRK